MRPMSAAQVEKLLETLTSWSTRRDGVDGLALVGSWAAGRDHAECDIDLVCLVQDPEAFRSASDWMAEIDWPAAGLDIKGWTDVDYGNARSRHLTFGGGEEIEMSFVGKSWAETDPVDPVTRRVAGDGLRVLHDPQGLLRRLVIVL
jgi:predicted nucleotidyltransferase